MIPVGVRDEDLGDSSGLQAASLDLFRTAHSERERERETDKGQADRQREIKRERGGGEKERESTHAKPRRSHSGCFSCQSGSFAIGSLQDGSLWFDSAPFRL